VKVVEELHAAVLAELPAPLRGPEHDKALRREAEEAVDAEPAAVEGEEPPSTKQLNWRGPT